MLEFARVEDLSRKFSRRCVAGYVIVAFRLIENPSDSPSLIEEVGVYEYVVVQLGEFHIYSRNRDYDRNKFHENLDSKSPPDSLRRNA